MTTHALGLLPSLLPWPHACLLGWAGQKTCGQRRLPPAAESSTVGGGGAASTEVFSTAGIESASVALAVLHS
jgi:hypothetical protein